MVAYLPTLTALLNACAAILLIIGYINIKRGREQIHRRFMICALIMSVLFLTSYLTYHYQVGSVPYPYHDWTRTLYFIVLIPHVILAAAMVPFIITLVTFALKGNFERHRRLARYVWPVWLYVSITGDIVYLMLYRL